MISTIALTKTSITRGEVQPGDVIDGCRVTKVAHRDGETRLRFRGEGWGEWLSAGWPVSVYR
jgi:hypothetical protein